MKYSKLFLTLFSGIALGFAVKRATTEKMPVSQEIFPTDDYTDGTENPDAFGMLHTMEADDSEHPMFI